MGGLSVARDNNLQRRAALEGPPRAAVVVASRLFNKIALFTHYNRVGGIDKVALGGMGHVGVAPLQVVGAAENLPCGCGGYYDDAPPKHTTLTAVTASRCSLCVPLPLRRFCGDVYYLTAASSPAPPFPLTPRAHPGPPPAPCPTRSTNAAHACAFGGGGAPGRCCPGVHHANVVHRFKLHC
jgi:hypothetical protein